MTLAEAHTTLKTRVGWKEDNTADNVVLSTSNQTSDSGSTFNMVHPAITLGNILDCQPNSKITSDEFNDYLSDLRDECVRQVLNDAFEKDYIDDNLLDAYPSGFDEAIRLKMVIIVGEIIMTSVRSNRTERFSREFASKLNYDLYREAPNKFAIRDANYVHTLGVATKYAFELKSVQRRFGDMRNVLRTMTKGEVFNAAYYRRKYRD